jgi:glycosyltransferase involved in cell wall biosynthesis
MKNLLPLMTKPLISVITINYNNLEGLKKTTSSVLEQTWQEFEYIIIDGGSTDGSKEYLEDISNSIEYWISEPDSGVYNAMNKGIRVSNGEYLLFLNSGDWLFNHKVLDKVKDNLFNCDALYGNMLKVFPDKTLLDKGVNGNELTFKTFGEGNLNHQATFISKKLFKKYGLYDENLKIVADWKFFLIALGMNNSTVKYLDSEISYYDMTGLSSNINARDAERLRILQEEIPFPIYKDYLKLKEKEKFLNSTRMKMFIRTDKNGISRKLHSMIFKFFLK